MVSGSPAGGSAATIASSSSKGRSRSMPASTATDAAIGAWPRARVGSRAIRSASEASASAPSALPARYRAQARSARKTPAAERSP